MKLQLVVTDVSAADLAHFASLLTPTAETGTFRFLAGTALTPPLPTGTASIGAASPPVVSAPVPNVPATPQTDDDESQDSAPTGNVDKDGLSWDARIHSDPAKLTGKGVWRKRRGVDDATVAQVEAELKEVASGIPQPSTPPAVAAPVTPPAPPPIAPPPVAAAPVAPPVAAPVTPPAPPPLPTPPAPVAAPAPEPAPPAPPVAPAAPVAADPFSTFMNHLSGQFGKQDAAGAPLIHTEYLSGVVSEINTAWTGQPGFTPLSVITDLGTNPLSAQVIPYAQQLIERDQRW